MQDCQLEPLIANLSIKKYCNREISYTPTYSDLQRTCVRTSFIKGIGTLGILLVIQDNKVKFRPDQLTFRGHHYCVTTGEFSTSIVIFRIESQAPQLKLGHTNLIFSRRIKLDIQVLFKIGYWNYISNNTFMT